MPCSNRTKVSPILRAALRFLSAALLVLASQCSSATAIVYELLPGPEPKESNRRILQFDAKRMFRVSERGNGAELELIFLRKETLKDVGSRISGEHVPVRRIPEIFPVRFHCFNYGNKTWRLDAYKFRIRSTTTKEIYPALTPAEYDKQYFSEGSSGLPYYWAFEQKDSFQFLHTIPEWFVAMRAKDTSSSAEQMQAKRESVRKILESHAMRTQLPPGRELKGYLIFPELPEGKYVLESTDAGSEAFPLRPVFFEIKRTYAANHDVEKTADDARAYRLFEHEIIDVERELAEFHAMHRQLHLHDKLRTRSASNK